MVVAGFLRIVTNPKVFEDPTPIAHAVGFIDALLGVSGVEMAELGREWPLLRNLCLDRELHGNDIADGWIAAAVKAMRGHLVTFDYDFSSLLDRRQLTVLSV
jgi:predicted nucleic acid-binding protein